MNRNLEAPANNFRKTHLLLNRHSLSLTVKMVRELNLCFYHDGNLPLLLAKSRSALLRSVSTSSLSFAGFADSGILGLRG